MALLEEGVFFFSLEDGARGGGGHTVLGDHASESLAADAGPQYCARHASEFVPGGFVVGDVVEICS